MQHFSLLELENKFGSLLTFLADDANLRPENIEYLLIHNSYFDFLELGQAQSFLKDDLATIYEKITKEKCPYRKGKVETSSIYWAGMVYMFMAIISKRPLRQIMVVLPFKTLLQKFPVGHEISLKEFYEEEMKEIGDVCPAGLTLKEKGISQSLVMYSLDISLSSVNRLFNSRKGFFSFRASLITDLGTLFGIDECFLRERSRFFYFGESSYSTSGFLLAFSKALSLYLGLKGPIDVFSIDTSSKDSLLIMEPSSFDKAKKKEIVKTHKNVFFYYDKELWRDYGKKKTIISGEELDVITKIALAKTADDHQ